MGTGVILLMMSLCLVMRRLLGRGTLISGACTWAAHPDTLGLVYDIFRRLVVLFRTLYGHLPSLILFRFVLSLHPFLSSAAALQFAFAFAFVPLIVVLLLVLAISFDLSTSTLSRSYATPVLLPCCLNRSLLPCLFANTDTRILFNLN